MSTAWVIANALQFVLPPIFVGSLICLAIIRDADKRNLDVSMELVRHIATQGDRS